MLIRHPKVGFTQLASTIQSEQSSNGYLPSGEIQNAVASESIRLHTRPATSLKSHQSLVHVGTQRSEIVITAKTCSSSSSSNTELPMKQEGDEVFFPGPPFIWLSSEKVSLTFRVGFPTSNNLTRLIPHRCAQQLISQVSANPGKVLAKTNLNNLHLSHFLSCQTLSQPTSVHTLLDTLYREGTLSFPLHTGHSFYLQKCKCNQISNILKCAVVASHWQSPAIQPLA